MKLARKDSSEKTDILIAGSWLRGGRGRRGTGRGLQEAARGAQFVEAILPGLLQAADFDAGGQKFGNVQDAMGLRGFAARPRRLFRAGRPIERARQLAGPLHHSGQMAGAGRAGIGHVVDAKRRADFPEVKTGPHTIPDVGQGINGVARMGFALKPPKEVVRILPVAEGQPGPPDITLADVPDSLFGQRLGAAVETAGRVVEAKVRLVQFVEAAE